ncbi:MAG: MEMO1 family protein [Thermoplasmatales archaeon]|nr:MAG: MEMO1 family protein [Thermoplasmatales archaeon]
MENVRKPVVAGQFYSRTESSLREQVKECFLDARGCGKLPEIGRGEKNIMGVVVPHAGFVYSGAIASHSYFELAKNGFADTFIVIGPNHSGRGSGVSLMTEGKWETSLGKVSINASLAEKIHTGIVDKDETAHAYEHSIEVQLPFLQFIAKDKMFDFVPICMMMQDYETSYELGNILAETIKKSGKNIAIIASSDFSHAGFNYMSMPPPGMKVDDYADKQDKLAISKILEMDPEGLISTVQTNNITMCGYGPVSAMLVAAKKLGATKVELLKYGNSYEVYPSTSCVGYGAIVIY